ncbi:Uncharacterised protein [BD1-7 clade bacterium]|uniref:Uncharacterized protein n=1 Tax=BD1-7 clade bacterium TaxID=2029982 RepID=A0A5S9QWI5_9GAMM|nr:Uncharacterised protein [BD1-7 clade bacterium]CAA0122927.1 Uncharacterised protein [BD1-7 clade bacterium]
MERLQPFNLLRLVLKDLSPEEKFFLVAFGGLLNANYVGRMANTPLCVGSADCAALFGMSRPIASRCLNGLLKKGYLDYIDGNRLLRKGRGRPKRFVSYSQKSISVTGQHSTFEDWKTPVLVKILGLHEYRVRTRLLLMVLVVASDDFGLVRQLGRSNIKAMTGLAEEALKNQVNILHRQHFLRYVVSGASLPHLLGNVPSLYCLNLNHPVIQTCGAPASNVQIVDRVFTDHTYWNEAERIRRSFMETSRVPRKAELPADYERWMNIVVGFSLVVPTKHISFFSIGIGHQFFEAFIDLRSSTEVARFQAWLFDRVSVLMGYFPSFTVSKEEDSLNIDGTESDGLLDSVHSDLRRYLNVMIRSLAIQVIRNLDVLGAFDEGERPCDYKFNLVATNRHAGPSNDLLMLRNFVVFYHKREASLGPTLFTVYLWDASERKARVQSENEREEKLNPSLLLRSALKSQKAVDNEMQERKAEEEAESY